MISLDITNKTDITISTKHFTLENDILTLEIDCGDYDLADKTITAAFAPAKVESSELTVSDGIVQLPIYAAYIQEGYNTIQLNFRWETTKLEQSGIITWIIDKSVPAQEVADTDADIITSLIAQVQSAISDADTKMDEVDTALEGIAAMKVIGAYNVLESYEVGNRVTYSGSCYECIADTDAGTLPTDTDYFILIAEKGADGADLQIDDESTATDRVWSANKVGAHLADIAKDVWVIDNKGKSPNARRLFFPASALQIISGTPSFTMAGAVTTQLQYWSLSGSTYGQALGISVGDLGNVGQGVEISIIERGVVTPASNEHEVWCVKIAQLIDGDGVDDNLITGSSGVHKALPLLKIRKTILDSFIPVDPSAPTFITLARQITDARDNWNSPAGVVGLEVKPVVLDDPITIQAPSAYNSWPFIVSIGSKLVCMYSKGSGHGTDTTRGVWRKTSIDSGFTWSNEIKIIDTTGVDDTAVGKGYDSNGNIILWVRRGGPSVDSASHHLYQSSDGDAFTLIASPTFAVNPVQISDIFNVPTVGLMAFYHSGSYDVGDSTKSWGIVTSADDGVTWTQTQKEGSLGISAWPTEISGAYIGSGKIIAIGRNEFGEESTARGLFQLQSTDYGATWTRALSNINDTLLSTGSLIYDTNSDTLSLYYYHRSWGVLRLRKGTSAAIWGNPLDWSASKPIAVGSRVVSDAGNANALALPDKHIVVYYSGDDTDCGIYAVNVSES